MPKPPKVTTKAKRAAKKAAPEKNKSLEQWIWDAACSIRGAKDAPKYKDFILLRDGYGGWGGVEMGSECRHF